VRRGRPKSWAAHPAAWLCCVVNWVVTTRPGVPVAHSVRCCAPSARPTRPAQLLRAVHRRLSPRVARRSSLPPRLSWLTSLARWWGLRLAPLRPPPRVRMHRYLRHHRAAKPVLLRPRGRACRPGVPVPPHRWMQRLLCAATAAADRAVPTAMQRLASRAARVQHPRRGHACRREGTAVSRIPRRAWANRARPASAVQLKGDKRRGRDCHPGGRRNRHCGSRRKALQRRRVAAWRRTKCPGQVLGPPRSRAAV
jgi:hypothetical protein